MDNKRVKAIEKMQLDLDQMFSPKEEPKVVVEVTKDEVAPKRERERRENAREASALKSVIEKYKTVRRRFQELKDKASNEARYEKEFRSSNSFTPTPLTTELGFGYDDKEGEYRKMYRKARKDRRRKKVDIEANMRNNGRLPNNPNVVDIGASYDDPMEDDEIKDDSRSQSSFVSSKDRGVSQVKYIKNLNRRRF